MFSTEVSQAAATQVWRSCVELGLALFTSYSKLKIDGAHVSVGMCLCRLAWP